MIEVTPGLYSALLHFCGPYPRVLWIDALSINQNDEAEKSQQVKRMAEIYNRADKVPIWLGPEEDDSDLAMGLIRKISVGNFDSFVKEKTRAVAWIALAKLMRRKWFSRRWIIQEVAFARDAELWCGDEEVAWGKFAITVSLFETQVDTIKELFRALKRREMRMNTLKDVGMDSLFLGRHGWRCPPHGSFEADI